MLLAAINALLIFANVLFAQCVPSSGMVEGSVFNDFSNDGIWDEYEQPIRNAKVTAYDDDGGLIGEAYTDANGYYAFTGLEDETKVKLVFNLPVGKVPSFEGPDNGTIVQFAEVPSCHNYFAMLNADGCEDNAMVVLTCFVQDRVDVYPNMESIVSVPYEFTTNSPVSSVAKHGKTGSVWGLAWHPYKRILYSAAYIKQNSGVTDYGADAIYQTEFLNNKETNLFVKLSDLGVTVKPLTVTDPMDCAYGAQVGKRGLGSIQISPDFQSLYVINISEKEIVKINLENPIPETTEIFKIPNSECSGGEAYPFASKFYDGKLYVGLTCSAEYSKNENDSYAVVYKLDENNTDEPFEEIFATNYIKGFWNDDPSNKKVSHWFTDIDFTDDGNMIIALSDRVGHRYCTDSGSRVDRQSPDILMVWNDNGVWKLENNAVAGSLFGAHPDNNEGPGGGEFFDDNWIANPISDPETAIGSLFTLRDRNSVITTAYDPLYNTYSGGLIRLDTRTGKRIDGVELYQSNIASLFGKATGFGEIKATCIPPKIQIGNLVWLDSNKNGLQDADEPGIKGFKINLYDEDLNIVAQTISDENGQYIFDNLIPLKTYFIGIDVSNFTPDEEYLVNDGKIYEFTVNTEPSDESESLENSDINFSGQKASDYLVEIFTLTTNHNYDIGLIESNNFDLALINEYEGGSCVKLNDIAPFKISVKNQGTLSEFEYTLVAYLTPNYEFVPELNPDWVLVGNKAYLKISKGIDATVTKDFYINLRVKGGAANDYILYAEIVNAKDLDGNDLIDSDSTMDDDVTNDAGGEFQSEWDDVMTGNGSDDEDDHDPAAPPIFDMALKYEVTEYDESFTLGTKVKTLITVYNQGILPSEFLKLVVNLPAGLDFEPSENPGWTLVGDKLYFDYFASIPVSYKSEFDLIFRTNENASGDMVWYAEIVQEQSSETNCDFDSVADDNLTNDKGGQVNSSTDNLVTDHGEIDEDDNDPVSLNVKFLDLALIKYTEKTVVEKGELVDYFIEIFNQGDVPVYKVMIADYLADETKLEDSNWTMANDHTATREIEFPDGLGAGENYIMSIKVRIDADADHHLLMNYAEIAQIFGKDGVDISDMDIDSSPDMDESNDAGGKYNTSTDNQINGNRVEDEDDHDPAALKIIDAYIEDTRCLQSTATTNSGFFEDDIVVEGPPSEEWEVLQVVNGYVSPVSDPAVEISAGTLLSETAVTTDITSQYRITVAYETGTIYTIRFINNAGDTKEISNGPSEFLQLELSGKTSICGVDTETYSLSEDIPGASYTWSLSNPTGGVIIGSGSIVTIDWAGISGIYEINVEITGVDDCYYIVPLNVSVGLVEGAMACIGDLQLSLGASCSMTVTPQMLSSIPLDLNAPYSVMLTDAYGNAIPNATLTAEHVGTTVMAKLVESCGQNSCWSFITVEDKMAPSIVCEDLSLPCYKIGNFFGPVVNDNCGGEVQMVLLNSVTNVLTCDPDYSKEIISQYQAIDQYGNKSAVCEITMSVERPDFDLVVPPLDLLKSEGNNLVCSGDFPEDELGNPDPVYTGVPTIDGIPMYPSFEGACYTGVGYSDRIIEFSGCVTKVMRTWTLAQATCDFSDPLEFVQTIEIVDTDKPTIECPDPIVASASSGNCEATVLLPSPLANDACSGTNYTIDIHVDDDFFFENQSSALVTLSTGVHVITYRVYDACGNSNSCTTTVTVNDKTPPTVVCDQNTIVGLNSNGVAYIYASSIDDGSTDACGIAYMEVRRVEVNDVCGLDNEFGPSVAFCCNDVGQQTMVELRVWDYAGNSNSCMVNVVVQDKFPPVITPPANMTISCEQVIDFNNLSEFGTPTVTDACGALLIEHTPYVDINTCRTGEIIRYFEATDANGSASAQQVITIVNDHPFDFVIDWPEDVFITDNCSALDLSPDNLPDGQGYPTYDDGVCAQVGVTYKDLYFPIEDVNGACFKIIRRWTIVDDCQPDVDPALHDQTIMVSNTISPTIVGDCNLVPEECNNDGDCDNGFIVLSMSATDDCTPASSLAWSYKIDLNSDGVFEQPVTGVGPTASASGDYPVGEHVIVWSFEDMCGNVTSCEQHFKINNCVKPVVACKDSVSIALEFMHVNGSDIEMACLTAESLAASSSHPCDYDYYFSFDTLTLVEEMCFSCYDIGFNDKTIYIIDEFGNYSSCDVVVEVQDNNDVDICPTFDLALIKTFHAAQSTIQYGSDVQFDILVCNQGSENVIRVDVNDYIPVGYTLNDPDWTLSGSTAKISLLEGGGIIPAGGIPSTGDSCITVPITLTLNNTGNPDDYINYAEIDFGEDTFGFTSANDIDSEADSNTSQEKDVLPNSPGDNDLYSDGADGNQDDHDPAVVPFVDLALIKVELSTGPYTYGDDVILQINVVNQGTLDATNVMVTDYIPCGFTLSNTNPGAWTVNAGGNATQIIPFIQAGAEVNLNISLTLQPCTDENAWLNYAEISSFDGGVDIDSTPDSNVNNDAGGVPNSDTDNVIDNSNGDEDDQDPALVEVFDLALTKTIVPNTPYDFGDTVTFNINIYNQGNVTATEFSVVDYLQCGFTFDSSLNPDWTIYGNGKYVVDINTNLNPGQSMIIPVSLIVVPCGLNTELFNYAEISSTPGEVDADSDPDINPDNDGPSVDDDIENTDGDEDDSDGASIILGPCNVDLVAPICASKDTTIVLSNTDYVVINPSWIDGGSTDDCSDVSLSVEPDTLFCSDLGDNTVILYVTDQAGNTSSCEATVTIDFQFEIQCVQDTVISLDIDGVTDLNPADFFIGDQTICGQDLIFELSKDFLACNDLNLGIVTTTLTVSLGTGESSSCDITITVIDSLPPVLTCVDQTYVCNEDYSIIPPSATDNCTEPELIVIDTISIIESLNQCGIGFISYTYTGTDLQGNVSSPCTQVITITSPANGFDLEDTNYESLPDTITISDCTTLDPTQLEGGALTADVDGLCALVSIDYSDTNLTPGGICIDTFERVWTVIDSCNMINSDSLATYYFTQYLIVIDTFPPVISGVSDTIISGSYPECEAYVDLSNVSATDCTPVLTVSNNSPYADDSNSLDASGTYPTGTTTVIITAVDDCGNIAMDTFTVTIENTKPYAVECFKIFKDIQDDGTVTVTPEDFLFGVFGDCDNVLDFSFSPTDINLDEEIYTCADVGDVPETIYWYENGVLVDSCESILTILDPNDICSGNLVDLTGSFRTSNGKYVNDVLVDLEGSELPQIQSIDGHYSFSDMPMGGEYTVVPNKNINHLVAVSTLDLVLIQRHILGLQKFDNPYTIVAADINNDEKVSASDLIELRKNILGLKSSFANNTSWKFIDKKYDFPINNPLNSGYPLVYYIPELYGNMIVDFVGVKIGDVNNSYTDELRSTKDDNRAMFNLNLVDQYISENEEINLDITIPQSEWYGLQLSLDQSLVEILSANVDKTNIVNFESARHKDNFNVILYNGNGVNEEVNISLSIKAKQAGRLSELLRIGTGLNAEIYTHELEKTNLALNWQLKENELNNLALVQNTPNPWANSTFIEFYAPESTNITLTIKDINAKVVYEKEINAVKGWNRTQVSENNLPIAGIYVYDITDGNSTISKRMILLNK